MNRFAKLMSIAMLVAIPSSALAWGQDGHRIIGQIAQERVNGRTAASIEQILGEEDLAEASTWADEERSNPDTFWQTEAGPYHYVTVPIGTTLEAVGSPEEGDGLTALRRFTRTVRSADATQEEKALALRFIVHIVGGPSSNAPRRQRKRSGRQRCRRSLVRRGDQSAFAVGHKDARRSEPVLFGIRAVVGPPDRAYRNYSVVAARPPDLDRRKHCHS